MMIEVQNEKSPTTKVLLEMAARRNGMVHVGATKLRVALDRLAGRSA
jgi:hypothetical protein